MKIYAVRSTTLKFASVLILSLAVLASLIVILPVSTTASAGVSYDRVYTSADRIGFLSQFGWTVDETDVEEVNVTIPSEFDAVYSEYNDIQKSQGLNLNKYRGKDVTRYTYKVTNYDGCDGTVYANLLVYKGKIVGGDLCCAENGGFVSGFDGKKV
ncbi:MAG: DUF4830 domain-containing protein [Clostridia bacterium]|nr:DUF4830 domain-containing protein [Clostridia bacterium]